MKFGIALRSMGPQSEPEMLLACAQAAEAAGLDDLWVQDHLAIPPDDAEGSNGRYLDPLATLAWLAGQTESIGLGTGVLILPYRPPLPTAKWVATVQELSGGRLRLGVGVGWMKAEFRALGVARERRGRITDETLEFLQRCFGRRRGRSPRPALPVPAATEATAHLRRWQRPPRARAGGALGATAGCPSARPRRSSAPRWRSFASARQQPAAPTPRSWP